MRQKTLSFVLEFSNTLESQKPRVKTEILKYKMKGFIRQFSIQLKRRSRLSLEKRLKEPSESLRSNCTENIAEDYENCKAKLDSIYDYVSKGTMSRSIIHWN